MAPLGAKKSLQLPVYRGTSFTKKIIRRFYTYKFYYIKNRFLISTSIPISGFFFVYRGTYKNLEILMEYD